MKIAPATMFYVSLAIQAVVCSSSLAQRTEETVSATSEAAVVSTAKAAGIDLGGRDPVDVALDYVQAKIHTEHSKKLQLVAKLEDAVRNGEALVATLQGDEAKLHELPRLQNRVAALLAEKTSALAQLSQEWAQSKHLAEQLQNSTFESKRRSQILARAHRALSQKRRENAGLTTRLQNITTSNIELSDVLTTLHKKSDSLQQSQNAKDIELKRSRSFISNMRESLNSLHVAESQDQKRFAITMTASDKISKTVRELEAQQKTVNDELTSMNQKYTALSTQEKHANQANEELSARLTAEKVSLVRLLQREAIEQKHENVELTKDHVLRQQILKLRQKLAQADAGRQQAENQAATAKDNLFTASAQVQEVKDSVPYLQKKYAEEQSIIQNATIGREQAFAERDRTKEALADARKKTAYMEHQYAEIVKMVGQNVAKEAAGGGDVSVVANLSALMHATVPEPPPAAVHSDDDYSDDLPSETLPQDLSAPTAQLASMDSVVPAGSPAGELDMSQQTQTVASITQESALQQTASIAPKVVVVSADESLEQDSKGLEDLLGGIVPDASS